MCCIRGGIYGWIGFSEALACRIIIWKDTHLLLFFSEGASWCSWKRGGSDDIMRYERRLNKYQEGIYARLIICRQLTLP